MQMAVWLKWHTPLANMKVIEIADGIKYGYDFEKEIPQVQCTFPK